MIRIASCCLMVYWIAIFVATHLPASTLPALHWSDKAYHVLAYCGLGFLLAWAIPTVNGMVRHMIIVALVGVCYACLDELTQMFIPGRSADFLDFMADAVGVGCGMAAYLIIRRVLCSVRVGRQLIHSLSR